MNKLLYYLYLFLPGRFKEYVKRFILNIEGGEMYSNTIRAIYKFKYNIEIGYGTYGGCFNASVIPSGVVFGNYCSIAPNIKIFRANHPKDRFTTHPILYNPVAGYVHEDQLKRPRLLIGHDVWISEWAIILPSVMKIGNGAIIGAGTVVTKDVRPYSIVVGNPGKEIGFRFSSEVIDKIEQSKWWSMSKDELVQNIEKLDEMRIV